MKADVDKLDINILTNFPSELNYFKSKIDKLDVDKLLSVPVDIKNNKWCSEQRSCYKYKS